MPHPTPYPRCIFCGDKANSREHAIPKWIGRRLHIKDVELRPAYVLNIDPGHQPVRVGSHRRRIFCAECNGHFKHLEDEAIPVVEWIARGKPISLGETEQDILARWGAKTGYAIISAQKEMRSLVPDEHTRRLRYEGTVHPLTWVGYASWHGHTHVFGGDHAASTEGGTIRAYGVALCIGQMALKVRPLRTGPETLPALRHEELETGIPGPSSSYLVAAVSGGWR